MRNLFLVALALLVHLAASQNSSPPPYTGNYYDSIDTSLTGKAFEQNITNLISNDINVITYDQLWDAFNYTDTVWASCPGSIHDIYSTKCWVDDKEQCGNYKVEGDCYNREHSWPKSWWGGSSSEDSYTDLHHIFPADGYDNSRRSNYPYGDVIPGTATYVSDNGSQLGECKTFIQGQTECWEPADYVKGDLARGYFYMSSRYLPEFTCCEEAGVDDAAIKEWMEFTLRSWHNQDPVSEDEYNRQNVIFQIQHNRNPYIDNPEWVSKILNF